MRVLLHVFICITRVTFLPVDFFTSTTLCIILVEFYSSRTRRSRSSRRSIILIKLSEMN